MWQLTILPLKAALRDAIANFKCFGAPGHQRPNSLCGATLFGSHQRHLGPLIWKSLVVFRLPCNAWQRSRMQNLLRVDEISGPILTRLLTKVHQIFRRYTVGAPSYFPTPLPIVYVAFHLEGIRHKV